MTDSDDSIKMFVFLLVLFLIPLFLNIGIWSYQSHKMKVLEEVVAAMQNGITVINVPNPQTGEPEPYISTAVASIKGITTHEVMPIFLRADHYQDYLEYKRKKIVNEFLVHNEKDNK